MLGICLLIVSIYAVLVMWMDYAFTKRSAAPPRSNNNTSFSIVIPCRNEAHNISPCLDAILSNTYPTEAYEIILVDDHSDDNSWTLMQRYAKKWEHVHAFKLEEGQGKKSALTLGINKSRNPWIITRDADTTQGLKWLCAVNDAVQENQGAKVLILPVLPPSIHDNMLSRIFSLEFLSLMGSGLACALGKRPMMANGANFAFRKDWFETQGGYKEHAHISSGDDVLFLQATLSKGKQFVEVCVSPESAVVTNMPLDIASWLDQRIRWGSKMSALRFDFTTAVSILVMTANFSLICATFLMYSSRQNLLLIAIWTIKLYPDWKFLKTLTCHFSRESCLRAFPLLAFLYPFGLWISVILMFFKKPKWKGRQIGV